MKSFFNGKLVEGSEASIPFDNKHAFFDFGCYDNVKVLGGRKVFAEKHARRFIESLKILGISPPSEIEIIRSVDSVITANSLDNSLVRLVCYPDFFYAFPVGLTFYPDKMYANGVKAITYEGERLMPKSKTMNLLLNYLAFQKAEKNQALEALLVDSNGFITEGTRSNFFIVKNGKIFTPPSHCVLDGVTRELIMQEFDVSEKKITLDDALSADECFISSTSMLAMPLSSIDDKQIAPKSSNPNWPISRKVLKKLEELEMLEIKK